LKIRPITALLSLAGFGIVVTGWYVLSHFYSDFLVPVPSEVAVVLYGLVTDQGFLLDLGATLYKTVTAVFIASAIGIPIGLLLGYSRRFYFVFQPLVDFFRSVQVVAAFPIFLLLFGLSDQAEANF
jgi:ABC-type nitrate/sulfonate/bicarbonate transport system permease component